MSLNKKILIIDDDNRNIFALKAVLKAKGFICLSALSAKEGIKLMQTEEIKLVLMDMMMPEMDGYEAMQAIMDIEIIANIPVIAVTAQAMVGDREKCLAAGALDYVSKPINVDVLLKIISNHLN